MLLSGVSNRVLWWHMDSKLEACIRFDPCYFPCREPVALVDLFPDGLVHDGPAACIICQSF